MAKKIIRIVVVLKTTGPEETYVPMYHIVKETELSEKYTIDLIKWMRQAGLVESKVGPNGGYRMKREVTVAEACLCCSDTFDYAHEETWSGRANVLIRQLLEKFDKTFI